jgi:hypothetical protein
MSALKPRAEVIDAGLTGRLSRAWKQAAVSALTGGQCVPGSRDGLAVDEATAFSQALLASPAARLRSTLDPA